MNTVLIADDGELADVRYLLREIGAEFSEVSFEEVEERAATCQLLVSSPRYAVEVEESILASSRGVHIVVCEKVSRTLQNRLERSSCDFVVKRPFHSEALRLLLVHALYTGPEKRRIPRAAIHAPVKVKAGLLARSVTMAALSLRGCGLVTKQAMNKGAALQISLPRELTESDTLVLDGKVVGCRPPSPTSEGYDVAVTFSSVSAGTRKLIHKVMSSSAFGSSVMTPEVPNPVIPGRPQAEPKSQPASTRQEASPHPTESSASQTETQRALRASDGPPKDRRSSPRKVFTKTLLAGGAGSALTIMGRDLSAGGMRVAPSTDLALGDELKLALYGHADHAPIMLKADITRDAGEEGWVLQFRDVSSETVQALESFVESLPVLARQRSGVHRTAGVVVSQVIERDGRKR